MNSATAMEASLPEETDMPRKRSLSETVSPSVSPMRDPPVSAACFEMGTRLFMSALPASMLSRATKMDMIFVREAGGIRASAFCS